MFPKKKSRPSRPRASHVKARPGTPASSHDPIQPLIAGREFDDAEEPTVKRVKEPAERARAERLLAWNASGCCSPRTPAHRLALAMHIVEGQRLRRAGCVRRGGGPDR